MLVEAGAGETELRHPATGRLVSTVAADAAAEALPGVPVGARRQARWSRRYRFVLIALDCLIGLGAGFVMLAIRPGEDRIGSPYMWLAMALPLVWPLAVGVAGGYSPAYYGTGSEEFRKVAR